MCLISLSKKTSWLKKKICFFSDKIGDYFGNNWLDAIEYALAKLNKK